MLPCEDSLFYKQERKGKLFNFREGTEAKYRFDFPDSDAEIQTDGLSAIDRELLDTFRKRVAELG